jgi:hypothetical protein
VSGRGRAAVAIGAVAAVVVLFFVFRAGGDDDSETTPTTTAPATTETVTDTVMTATVETEPLPPPPPAGPVRARITVRGGEVVGGRRLLKVKQGKQFVLIVNADVSDHVHLHGYDLMADVAPGKPARLRFNASIAGRFEIELEDRAFRLGELEVRP